MKTYYELSIANTWYLDDEQIKKFKPTKEQEVCGIINYETKKFDTLTDLYKYMKDKFGLSKDDCIKNSKEYEDDDVVQLQVKTDGETEDEWDEYWWNTMMKIYKVKKEETQLKWK